jgi:sodium/hydrogen antiporter
MLGTDDLLACFVAGNALNWDGQFLEETEKRHDEVNSCVDVLLNFGGFMYIGTIMPWEAFNQPDITGITIGRLIGLGILVLIFRRIPAIFMVYKFMPKVVKDWKEALFMGYFGPIGERNPVQSEHSVGRLADMRVCKNRHRRRVLCGAHPALVPEAGGGDYSGRR